MGGMSIASTFWTSLQSCELILLGLSVHVLYSSLDASDRSLLFVCTNTNADTVLPFDLADIDVTYCRRALFLGPEVVVFARLVPSRDLPQ